MKTRKRKSIEFRTVRRFCYFAAADGKKWCFKDPRKVFKPDKCNAANCPIWRRLPDVEPVVSVRGKKFKPQNRDDIIDAIQTAIHRLKNKTL